MNITPFVVPAVIGLMSIFAIVLGGVALYSRDSSPKHRR